MKLSMVLTRSRCRPILPVARLGLVALLATTLVVGAMPGVLLPAAQADTSVASTATQPDPTAGLVEAVEQRTATTKTFLTDAAGKFLTQAFSGPVHYRSRPGHEQGTGAQPSVPQRRAEVTDR